ncbi:transcriptional regulator [Saccharopolyspora rhizosphaerae]|uniref:Transcriptional regulator n=1 Tax=Saccharopolyspora rhizosphaerae TaxID=2492662 RepID=A0A3R8VM35_9PSEU|nr:transcriptional regulator [Saccharopolyspora rhizosphaerae]RRO20449.1 transcriptional regulator [Saccharopolyspora rhizosphaerae]
MSVVIGVLVHVRHQDVFRQGASTTTGATLRWAVHREPEEAGDRLRELVAAPGVDGLLLGPRAHEALHDQLPAELAVAVVRPGALELALAVARMRADHPEHRRASIDTFDQHVLQEVATTLGVRHSALPHPPGQPVEEVIAHHRQALHHGGVVITPLREVAEALRAEAPVVEVELLAASVRSALQDLALRARTARAEEHRFAVGVFQVRDGADVEGARDGLREVLLQDPQLAGAWVEDRGTRGVLVFAHQALLQRATADWQVVPALHKAGGSMDVRIAAGFGLGASVRAGIALADRAAVRAEAEPYSCGFVIQDSGVIIGPIGGNGRRAEFSYRDHGAEVERLAHEVGLSPATLSRLESVERELHGRAVTPSELATLLGITDPSGRRLIRKLSTAELVTAEGSAQPTRRGRPTRLYRLRLGNALSPPDPTCD